MHIQQTVYMCVIQALLKMYIIKTKIDNNLLKARGKHGLLFYKQNNTAEIYKTYTMD